MNKQSVWLRLITVTALGLGTVGFAIAQHVAAAKHAEPPRYALVLSQVQMRRIPSGSNVPGSIAYQVDVFVGCRGPRPSWWGQVTGRETGNASTTATTAANGPRLLYPGFVDRKGKKNLWNPYGMMNGLYDPARQEYYVDSNVEINGPDDVDVRNSAVVGTIQMGDGRLIPVAAPTRLALQHPPKPSPGSPYP